MRDSSEQYDDKVAKMCLIDTHADDDSNIKVQFTYNEIFNAFQQN